ncbi:MAG: hypothetical protein ACRDKW_16530 [Actinomycetota bacterium]
MVSRTAFVHAARLELAEGADPRAPGGAVTLALCGAWEHPPACRWPHQNALDDALTPTAFRTVFVAPPDDEARVRALIVEALRSGEGWRLVGEEPAALADAERALADRLLRPRS